MPRVMMLGLRSMGEGQGGIERHVERLARELDAMGIGVDVLVRRPYQPTGARLGNAIRVIPLWCPRHVAFETLVHSLLGVIYAIFKRPAVLHVHGIGPGVFIPLARLFGLSVVATHHGEDYRREKWGPLARAILRLGEWCQGRFADQCICVSESLARRLSHRFHRAFEYVPNGAELVHGDAGLSGLAPFGLMPLRYLLAVSRIVPEKRHLDLIAAFGKLGRDDLKLAIVGAADHDGQYSRRVVAAADEVPGVVLTGFQQGRELASLFANASLFVLPSSHEGLPIALLEAMSYGRRVLVSDIEPNLDVGLPARCYHKLGNIDDIARGMAEALSLKDTTSDWSEKLRSYEWTEIARKTSAIYRSMGRAKSSDSSRQIGP